MAMETHVVTVTPEMAKCWLENNPRNRKLSADRINQYALAILSGHWALTHQGIAFDQTGALLDGQHRLNAIIKAGIPVPMNVTTGVERRDGELLEIDTGRGRTYNNILSMAGVDDRLLLSFRGVVNSFLRYKVTGKKSSTPAYVSRDYIERHREECAFIANAYGYTGKSDKSPGSRHAPAIVAAAALSALYFGENRDAVEKFGRSWVTNDPSWSRGYAVKLLFDAKDRMRTMKTSAETFNFLENTIRCYATGKQIVRCFDCYPLDMERAR